ncbi:MAG TPA: hypothetical protein VFY12_12305 [Arenimonas sp.]|nr:hypothetical protein [Arenimonas sp.]
MKFSRIALVALLLLSVSAPSYAGKMKKTTEPLVTTPDKATIVFMRPGKFVGAAIAVPVFDATADEAKFIGIVDAGSKFAYTVPAGEHLFATTIFGGASGTRLYKAQVSAGKTYYFRAHIIDGLWGLEPVRGGALDGDEFKKWDKGTKLTVNTEKSLAWGEANKAKATERANNLKAAGIGAENTLNLDDGR